ncbi:MAG: S41 family peptidase [Pseudomonadota bacterium]
MHRVKTLIPAFVLTFLAGCGGGGDGGLIPPPDGVGACTVDEEKQFVLDAMRDLYFWNTLLPANVNINDYATAEDLLAFLTSFQPLDSFSFITTTEQDTQFFGEGQFAGFGFSYRFENNAARFRFVYSGSPAANAGFERGQEIVAVDGQTVEALGASGLANAFGPSDVGIERTFRIRRLDGSEFEVLVIKDVVTIDPVPQFRVISTPGGNIGYIEFATFISTAESELATAFNQFQSANVNAVVLDLRYNGGGLVRIAELLGDYLGGGVANQDVFSRTLFNADNADLNSTELFQLLNNSLSLSRLVVIATGSTASASELVINSMEPHAEVVIVGDSTFGKPVGQSGILFCANTKTLRATTFETVNSLNEGQYFDGLPVDCPAADDLDQPVGADTDPSLATALSYLETGACPSVSPVQQKLREPRAADRPARSEPAFIYLDSV